MGFIEVFFIYLTALTFAYGGAVAAQDVSPEVRENLRLPAVVINQQS